MAKVNSFRRKRSGIRQKSFVKFKIPADANIDYKNLSLLQKFINERGKIIPRRITGVSAKDQRRLVNSIKRARFLALLPASGVKK